MVKQSGLALILAGVFFLGCSKKPAPTPPTPEPEPPRVETPAPEPTGPSAEELRRQRMQQRLAEALQPVYFEYDQSGLSDAAKSRLVNIGEVLKEYTEVSLTVQGHCDERGTEEYNFALGERRAGAIQAYLASYGIDAGRINTVSYGEERPAIQGSSEDVWSKNRRGEFDARY